MHICDARSFARWEMQTGEFLEAYGSGVLVDAVVNKRLCLKKNQGRKQRSTPEVVL